MYEPQHYDKIHYNEVIYYLETKWHRKLEQWEKDILVEGYRFGRYIEMENNFINEQIKGK